MDINCFLMAISNFMLPKCSGRVLPIGEASSRAVADGTVATVLAGPTLPKASSDFGLNSGHSFIIVRLTTVFTVILVVWLLS